MENDKRKIIDPGFGAVTERQALMIRACRVSMTGSGPSHPTMGNKPFGQMTEQELRELIAWYEPAGSKKA